MEKFTIIETTCVPLVNENVDTDQIIPARFLKATNKTGFGKNLFRDWRYDENGNPIENFVLNQKKYTGEILLTEKTSVAVQVANMPLGPFKIMVLRLLYRAFLPIFSKTMP